MTACRRSRSPSTRASRSEPRERASDGNAAPRVDEAPHPTWDARRWPRRRLRPAPRPRRLTRRTSDRSPAPRPDVRQVSATENLAHAKSPFRPSSSRRSSIRRAGSAPAPSVTGAIITRTSSSSPASANWPARSPPPTIQTFRPAAASTIRSCTVAMSALVNSIPASGTTGSCRCVKTAARDVVRPLPFRRILVLELVVEDPFVRRRAHGECADAGDELAVVQRPVGLLLASEQPGQRVVGVGDEAVEAGRRVVLGETHDSFLRGLCASPSYRIFV